MILDISEAELGDEHELPEELIEAFERVITYLMTQPFEERNFLAASSQPDGLYALYMTLYRTSEGAPEVH